MKKNYITIALALALALVLLVLAAVYFGGDKVKEILPGGEPVACTMEALICPDGSAVGRTGPNCEFASCPNLQESR